MHQKMKKFIALALIMVSISYLTYAQTGKTEYFPDGTLIPEWFHNNNKVKLKDLGKKYIITKHGVKKDSNSHSNRCHSKNHR
jgi:hypothetical protein